MNVLKTTNNIALFMATMIFASCVALNKAAVDRNSAQIRKLIASDGQGDDGFGNSVAIYGNTAIVGAVDDAYGIAPIAAKKGDVDSNYGQGSAYIFERNKGGANNWGRVKKLIASDGAPSDGFGSSMAIYRDTVVVGASADKIGRNEGQGSAYIFERNQGGADKWGQVRKLTASRARIISPYYPPAAAHSRIRMHVPVCRI